MLIIKRFYNNIYSNKNNNKILKSLYRYVNVIAPDLENEHLLRRAKTKENFDKIFSEIKLPFKLKRYPEYSRKFLFNRLEQYPNGFDSIDVNKYSELWLKEPENSERQKNIKKDIEMILMYYNDILRYSLFAPSTIPFQDMEKMLSKYDGHGTRIRYVNFLFIREFDDWCRDKEEEQKSQLKRLAEQEDYFEDVGCFDMKTNQLQYGYWRNTLFTRFFEKARHIQSIRKLNNVQFFGQPLIIDCGLEHLMADYELLSCVRQISRIYNVNRYSLDPFKLYFTEFDKNRNRTYEYLERSMKKYIDNKEYCFNLYSESYKQLLPDEKFIYLSPDSRKIMNKFDPNAVYIIGALVSKTQKSRLTFDKAMEQGIECLRLPIHQYVQLKPMVKRILSFRSTFEILLHLKHGVPWEQAIRLSIQSHKLMN